MSPQRSSHEWSKAVALQAAVAELGQLGLRGASVEDLLAGGITTLAQGLETPHVVLFEVVEEGLHLRGRAAIYHGNLVRSDVVGGVVVPGGAESFPGYTAQVMEPVATDALHDDVRFGSVAASYQIEVSSAIGAPIPWDEGCWGVLTVYSEQPRAWTPDEVAFTNSIAATIGLSLRREEVEHTLRDAVTRLDLALGAGGFGVWSWTQAGERLEIDDRFRELYGIDPVHPIATGPYIASLVHPDDEARQLDDALGALRSGGDVHQVFRIRRADDGEIRWLESWGRVAESITGELRLVGVTADITERREEEDRRAAALEQERSLRHLGDQVRLRVSLLAEASEAFAQSLDLEVLAEILAEFSAPRLADACFVDLFDEHGLLIERSARAIDADGLVEAQAVRRRPADAREGDHEEVLREVDGRVVLAVPLRARGEVIGVLTVVGAADRELDDADQRALVGEIASRAALALDNARLFASRNRVARSLQAALLPPVLPEVPGIDLAARYHVAEHDAEIGGDFYDVMEVAGGGWAVVIGDVCGRGADAAALTGLIRHSIRAAAVRERSPSGVLAQTNAAVLGQIDDSLFCTAAYLLIEPVSGPGGEVRVIVANAGHPRPIVRRANGGVEVVPCTGSLIGVIADPTLTDLEVRLAPGDALVLYTDGVTEARRGYEMFGEAALVACLAGLAGRGADHLAAGIEAAVTDFRDEADDDLAVVVVRAQERTPVGAIPVAVDATG